MTSSPAELPPQLPHGAIREVLPDVFMVSGESRPVFGGRTFQFSRNMIIVREGSALTLVNTVRLDDDGLARLAELGTVAHIVKLGAFHGRDDAFYVHRYGAAMWAFPGMPHERGVTTDHELVPSQAGPLKDASSFLFETSATCEGLLLLERHGGVLIACDSLQNWTGPDAYFDEPTAAALRQQGFFRRAGVGVGWKAAGKPASQDFDRVTALPFRHLLSAHGEPLVNEAHEALSATFAELFGG